MPAFRLMIRGRVQGVGYRMWTVRTATDRGLTGWVRNRSDGSVEALVVGEPEALEAFVEACRAGPRMARVDAIDMTPAGDETLVGFEQRPTA